MHMRITYDNDHVLVVAQRGHGQVEAGLDVRRPDWLNYTATKQAKTLKPAGPLRAFGR